MNEPQATAIEQVEADPPESADSDLSDEALDRPPAGGGRWCGTKPPYTAR